MLTTEGRMSTALLSGAASLRRLAEDTQQAPSPSHIILTPGQPVAALTPSKAAAAPAVRVFGLTRPRLGPGSPSPEARGEDMGGRLNLIVCGTIAVLVTLSYCKTVDISIPQVDDENLKDVETIVKEEEERLKRLNENPEFEELRIIDDPQEIPKILAKPRNANGDVIEEFKPIQLPTDFESYDVDPKDGSIQLSELITVTGAIENVEAAFNASDTNRDGVINLQEFDHAPWSLSGADDTDYFDYVHVDYDISSGDAEEEYLHLIHR